nr:reverse transcriptase domain-containing protein [Tanacetum cinerariifolium]
MPSRMTTRSAGQQTAAPRGGKTGGQTGRGVRRTEEPTRRVGGRTGDQGGQGGDRGVRANRGDDEVPNFSMGDVRSANLRNGRNGCSYKEFMVCNPKDLDGKSGAIAYTHLIEKMELVQDMSVCGANQKVKCDTLDGVECGLRSRMIGDPRWKIFEGVKESMRRSGRCGENKLNGLNVDG